MEHNVPSSKTGTQCSGRLIKSWITSLLSQWLTWPRSPELFSNHELLIYFSDCLVKYQGLLTCILRTKTSWEPIRNNKRKSKPWCSVTPTWKRSHANVLSIMCRKKHDRLRDPFSLKRRDMMWNNEVLLGGVCVASASGGNTGWMDRTRRPRD